jgi:hypothetical protein
MLVSKGILDFGHFGSFRLRSMQAAQCKFWILDFGLKFNIEFTGYANEIMLKGFWIEIQQRTNSLR